MRISDWSSDVCSSDLKAFAPLQRAHARNRVAPVPARPPHPVPSPAPGQHLFPAGGSDRAVRRRPLPPARPWRGLGQSQRSEEHTSELQSLMRISYAVLCLKKTKHFINLIIHTSI